jgi:hypothetical protein
MNEEDILAPYQKTTKEPLTETYPLKLSKEMKKKIFTILKKRNINLSVVLRSYIEKLILHYEDS